MAKIHFISFADSKMQPTLNRIKAEALNTGWFDSVSTVNEHFFDSEYLCLVKPTLHMRGFGYWRWKSYVIRRKMQEIAKDDIILYADAGCTINKNGYKRFREYIQLVENNKSGLLFFRQDGLKERAWTKADLLDYAGYLDNDDQLWGGGIFLRKTQDSVDFVEKYYELCNYHFELITDSPSILENDPSFVENRHDQSALSVIGKRYNAVIISSRETYTAGDFRKELIDFPIWANRNRKNTWWGLKKMGLKKRFPKLFGKLY